MMTSLNIVGFLLTVPVVHRSLGIDGKCNEVFRHAEINCMALFVYNFYNNNFNIKENL